MSTVRRVEINSDVYWMCKDHALSTEREEIMGLLLGDKNEDNVIEISAIKMLKRSDKRKDRVEISTDQLVAAAVEAEDLSKELGRVVRVVGWYHSHPHITVLPSAVDIRTQAAYQGMEASFVGLIFSVFPGQGRENKTQQLKIICFQSRGDPPTERVEVKLEIVPKHGVQEIFAKSVLGLPNILFGEETEHYKKHCTSESLSLLSKHQNESVFTSSIYHMMSVIEAPTIETIVERNQILQHQINYMKDREKCLRQDNKGVLKNLKAKMSSTKD
ncbi:lys-63-specific deubiquitinase BRCC36-like [Neocloeon triangulifer]|uniref:lys-63-specific deubiquitinase BRCC36-like n=1 Tax=Neocloeon triangulifer TaxID=2078957 RepID=UPI00286F21E6|nr:lys-63-specific deubiquitinase BRCC36-like [Neocloeon triangulifer]XP_059478826.1 lys-63-specific deubiquitinase BRCC36-like [Neocloeon triangulifer]